MKPFFFFLLLEQTKFKSGRSYVDNASTIQRIMAKRTENISEPPVPLQRLKLSFRVLFVQTAFVEEAVSYFCNNNYHEAHPFSEAVDI